MSNTKISALTSATTPLAGTEVLPIVQSSATTKVTVANLTAGRAISVLSLTSTNDSTINGQTIGRGAGSVSSNTAHGASALVSCSSGSNNTAIGNNALTSLTTIGNCTGVGNNALFKNVTGDTNTALGSFAGYWIVSNYNVAVGGSAMQGAANITGGSNTAIGYSALYAVNAGAENSALGYNTLAGLTSGNYNVGVGKEALRQIVSTNGSTSIGYQSGYSTTGATNTFLGYQSGYGVTSGTYNVIVGSYQGTAAPISATGSNHIVLSDGQANVRCYFDASGNGYVPTGNLWAYAPAPTAPSGAVTLTAAQLATDIINTTGTTYTVTLPLATAIDTQYPTVGTNVGLDFHIVNTASGIITIAVNTGITSVGLLTVAAATSAHFRLRRTAAATYILYRIS